MNARSLSILAAAGVVVLALCGGIVVLPIAMFGQMQAEASACGVLPELSPGASTSSNSEWDRIQVARAAVIVSIGRQRNIHPRGYVIALAVAMQESQLHNLANSNVPESLNFPHDGVGHDHDSVGLFQQRPAWGSVQERMTPAYAVAKFYDKLTAVDGWQKMRLTDAAQAVQRSAYPEAYQKWEDGAEDLAAQVLGLPNIDIIGGGDPLAPCGPDYFGPVPVGPDGWVQPIHASIVSPFGMRDGRLHAGVDLSRADIRGDPIRAAAAGLVEQVRCESSIGTCNRDGGASVRGCGWYVDIRHAVNIVTRYCHMLRQPEVRIGQRIEAGAVIGFVGSSGNSTGPHLHFEVHLNVLSGAYHANNINAIDPVPWMRERGAPIGQ